MRNNLRNLALCLALTAAAAFAQSAPLAFEVASIKPAAPLDQAKIAAGIQRGEMPKIGPHIEGSRAEYIYMALRDLIVMAYKVKPYQVTGPDWLNTTRFDIMAKMPEGSNKADAPKMLQALLEDRFKLVVRKESKENPVLGLVVGKGGPKLKESTEAPQAIDESAPLKPGEMKMDGPDGPIRMTVGKAGSATVNMGLKGSMNYKVDQTTMTMHLDGTQLSMDGFADMLTQLSQGMGGGGGRRIMDMTGLKGYYQVAIDFSLADLMNMARAQGMDIPPGAGGGGGGGAAGGATSARPADAASDPSGTTSLFAAVQALGLKLESRKAVTEQLVIEHAEKTPTEN
jgi:uncharacterized protein (TIGR03435 family)